MKKKSHTGGREGRRGVEKVSNLQGEKGGRPEKKKGGQWKRGQKGHQFRTGRRCLSLWRGKTLPEKPGVLRLLLRQQNVVKSLVNGRCQIIRKFGGERNGHKKGWGKRKASNSNQSHQVAKLG